MENLGERFGRVSLPHKIFSQTWSNAARFASNMVGSNYSETPAFLLLDRWMATGILAYETLCMSIIAIII